MSIIRAKTNKLFVPVTIQNNPLNPNNEMIILMRAVDNMDVYSLDLDLP